MQSGENVVQSNLAVTVRIGSGKVKNNVFIDGTLQNLDNVRPTSKPFINNRMPILRTLFGVPIFSVKSPRESQ